MVPNSCQKMVLKYVLLKEYRAMRGKKLTVDAGCRSIFWKLSLQIFWPCTDDEEEGACLEEDRHVHSEISQIPIMTAFPKTLGISIVVLPQGADPPPPSSTLNKGRLKSLEQENYETTFQKSCCFKHL